MPIGLAARSLAIAVAGAALLAGSGAAGAAGGGHHAQAPLTEAGQGAFAALAEAVARLEADPGTDWSRVDIAALREHLVDMNLLVLASTARDVPIEGGVEIEVRAAGRALEAVHRMVPAHAAELDRRPGWQATGRATPAGATLRVVSSDPADEAKIRALGFFGLMVLEQHHQAHHWAIASGDTPPHGH